MNTKTKTHDAGCIAHARKCAWENLRDDGQPIPASPELLTDETFAWEIPVGQLLAEWLVDGSVSCRCARPRSVLAEADAVDFAYAVCRDFVTQNLIDGEPVPTVAYVVDGYIDAIAPEESGDLFRALLTLRVSDFVDGLAAVVEAFEIEA